MRYFKFFYVIFIFNSLNVNANDIKIITLHNKTLDQLVLDNNESNISTLNNSNLIQENISSEEVSELDANKQELKNDDSSNNEIGTSEDSIEFLKTETIFDLHQDFIFKHLDTIKNIQSKTLKNEFIYILSNIQLEDESINSDKIYFIIKKLYEMGEMQSAYNLIKKINFNNITSDKHLSFFYFVELNFLFSSYKLSAACELKNSLLDKSITLPEYLLEKTDIFCLTLENKYSEARLLNSLLLESEKKTDQNFQKLFNFMILTEQDENIFTSLSKIKSKDLIFLYSAMLRINELPLNEDFIKIDPLNLSFPVILSEITDMKIRLKAANQAFYDDILSINSLSALYQSVDFNSKQFANPEKTILSLNSDELIMAYYYQLVNIQIFPDQRLDVILKYWDFAIKSGLEKIAYSITKNIIETFSLSAENSIYGLNIAFAYISNKNYEKALKWIEVYENSQSVSENSNYARFLINLNKKDDLDTIIKYLSDSYNDLDKNKNQASLESLDILLKFLKIENESEQKFSNINILDNRVMPSYFIIEDIKLHISMKNNLSAFMISLMSMQNRNWIELHPLHFKLILEAINLYDNGSLTKLIVLEILNQLKLL